MRTARDNRKAPAIGLAVALLLAGLGTVRADHEATSSFVTTGHTTWIDGGTEFDACFAAVAGGLMQRVVWFNGQTLFSRMDNGGGDAYMYGMETLDGREEETGVQPFDPSKETLFDTGNVFEFPDENEPDHRWEVHEYYFVSGTETPEVTQPPGGTNIWIPTPGKKVYVYVVHVADNSITDMTIGRDYNFVLLVNTCKFLQHGSETDPHNDGDDSNPRQPAGQHDPNDLPPGGCPPNDPDGCTHTHKEFSVDIFFGGKPNAVPIPGADTGDPTQGEEGGSP